MTLFEVDPPPPPPTKLSADARRTQRQRDLLAAGYHPATRLPLLVCTGETCGTCVHHVDYEGRAGRHWHKCLRSTLGNSASAASDIRVSWPACSIYKPDES